MMQLPINDILKIFLDRTTDAILICDDKMVIRYANDACRKLFDGALEGRRVHELLPTHLRDVHDEHTSNFIQSDRQQAMLYARAVHGCTLAGSFLALEVSVTKCSTDDGMFMVANIRDLNALPVGRMR